MPRASGRSRRFRLPYRPPYDWPALVGFLERRAIPGVERVDTGYARTVAIDGRCGWLRVTPDPVASALNLEMWGIDPARMTHVGERVARMFDVNAEPDAIADRLSRDRLLRPALATHPGMRVPGAWDPFEIAVRAILGQQISLRGATTLAGRVVDRWGTPVDGPEGLNRLFPSPATLAAAAIERIGLMPRRAGTIRALSKAVHDEKVTFDAGSTNAALRSIAGIGEWTAQYVAMRALNDPDAFLTGDLVLRQVTGCTARELTTRARNWQPWRAYAVMLLWQSAIDMESATRKLKTAN